MTPILIWEESSLLQPQMPSERIIKSTRRITDFFMEWLLFCLDILPTVYKVRLCPCQLKYDIPFSNQSAIFVGEACPAHAGPSSYSVWDRG
jgi:hypothetical protein